MIEPDILEQTWQEKLLFYTTAFFILLGTFSLFAFLFLVPFVIDPAFTTIFMEFDETPALCITVDSESRQGASNCSWSSCREGCTKEVYDCTQIRVNYKRATVLALLPSDSPDTDDHTESTDTHTHTEHIEAVRSKRGIREYDYDTDEDAMMNFDNSLSKEVMGLDMENDELLSEGDGDQEGPGGNNSIWYYKARLYPNVKGCGYPPTLNCSVFLKKYKDAGTNFSCYYSKVDRGIVISELDMWQVYMNLVYAMAIPIPSFIFSVIYLTFAYFKIYNEDEETELLEENAEAIDVDATQEGCTPVPNSTTLQPVDEVLTPGSEVFREDLASFGHQYKVAMADELSRESFAVPISNSISIPGSSSVGGSNSFVTIGSIRYGVRLGAVSPPPPGAHYRASVGLLHQQHQRFTAIGTATDHDCLEECCCGCGRSCNCGCGVVNLPWTRSIAAASVSQIPLLVDEQQPPINSYGIFSPVNSVDIPNSSTSCTSIQTELEKRNEHEIAVCRTHSPRVGIGGCWTASTSSASNKVQVSSSASSHSSSQLFLQNQLRRKVIVRSQSDATAAAAFVKFYQRDSSSGSGSGVQYADLSSTQPKEREQARHANLDRLNKFRFGGNRATNKDHDSSATSAIYSRGKKIPGARSSDDKAERLRELTDRWKRASQKYQSDATSQTYGPIPPPRNRHSGSYQQHSQHLSSAQKQRHAVQPHASDAPSLSHYQPITLADTSQTHSSAVAASTSTSPACSPSPLSSSASASASATASVPAAATVEFAGSPPPALPPSPPPAPPPAPPPTSQPHQPSQHLTSVADEFARVNSELLKPKSSCEPALVSAPVLTAVSASSALSQPLTATTLINTPTSTHRTVPFRSMSFSQVDYSPSDGKYIRRRKSDATDLTGGVSLTIPRKKNNQHNIMKNLEESAEKNINCTRIQDLKVDCANTDNEVKRLFEVTSNASIPSAAELSDISGSHSDKNTSENVLSDLTKCGNKFIPGNVTVFDGIDNGIIENEPDNSVSSCEDRKRDRSRRRKGMYISQWPGQRESVVLECNSDEQHPSDTLPSEDITTEDYFDASLSPRSFTEHDIINLENRKKVLECDARNVITSDQSCDDRDICGDNQNNKLQRFSRTDSLSEGESEQTERRPLTPNRDNININSLLGPNDLSDSEIRSSVNNLLSPRAPRRYPKRPLRGPYGQMLEAEMKKPDTNKIFTKHHQRNDLKFLDEFCGNNHSQRSSSPNMGAGSMVSLTSSNSMGAADVKSKHISHNRDASNHSLDETQLKNNLNASQLSRQSSAMNSPARKINVEVSSSAPTSVHNESEPEHQRLFSHQRTTSSPSKLEVITMPASQTERATSVTPSSELLHELLRGSSERLTVTSLSDSNSAIGTGSIMHDDTRTHIVIELYETERSYVESLHILVLKYLEPLKSPENSGLLDASLVDEIFYQIPDLLHHHQGFLEDLRNRLEHWNTKQKIGDVLLDFAKPAVVETYTAFINNWKRAKEVIKTTSQAKPAFSRFLEAMAREHKGKLALDSLLIKPVQKFPKYELLIQRLIKHTDPSHPDYQLLLEAQKEIHENLIKINCTERETLEFEQQQQNLKDLESLVEGLVNLVTADRTYLRHDLVTMTTGQGTRKERGLFLFSDLLVITSIKRRSGTIRKTSGNLPSSVTSSLDANKYKLLMRIPLEDVEIMKTKDENVRRMMVEIDNLTEDISLLNQITELTWQLHCPKIQLEDVLKEMLSNLNRQLTEQQSSDSQLSYLELTINTQNGIENLSVVFSQPEKRASWEEAVNDAKHKLAMIVDRRPSPEFLISVPIRKTRAGLQFTCASPTLTGSSNMSNDVWVCNSDGYVGQVCILSLYPEPTVTSCNGVCNARILCIASIPAGISNSSSSEDEDSERDEYSSEVRRKPAEKNKSSETTSTDSSDDTDYLQPTMWLGTEDGCIHVYNCNDNIRIKKNKIRLQHCSSIQCIIYLDNRVFVSLANGDITIYSRDQAGSWNISSPLTVSVGTSVMPVNKMLPNNGKLWCGCSITIKIFNIQSLTVEHTFQVNGDQNKPISCMVISGLGVWLSLQNSAIIKCFHSVTYEQLCEVNVAPSVTKMLTSCDDIIRQHKAACLRVTSLLACKDLLWIGTSAGVLLTMSLPHITASTTKISLASTIVGVPHGHTGHVRFLTCVESVNNAKNTSEDLQYSDNSKNASKLLIISGGDGYEDFRSSNVSEVAGREDSTNHLLLWHV